MIVKVSERARRKLANEKLGLCSLSEGTLSLDVELPGTHQKQKQATPTSSACDAKTSNPTSSLINLRATIGGFATLTLFLEQWDRGGVVVRRYIEFCVATVLEMSPLGVVALPFVNNSGFKTGSNFVNIVVQTDGRHWTPSGYKQLRCSLNQRARLLMQSSSRFAQVLPTKSNVIKGKTSLELLTSRQRRLAAATLIQRGWRQHRNAHRPRQDRSKQVQWRVNYNGYQPQLPPDVSQQLRSMLLSSSSSSSPSSSSSSSSFVSESPFVVS